MPAPAESMSHRARELYESLSCGLGRRDEKPNVTVGRAIAESCDTDDVKALVELLSADESSSSAVKALYECGYLAPDLLVPYADVFLDLLRSRKNRLVWGGMIALWCIAKVNPDVLWPRKDEIINAFNVGSAITREAAINALSLISASDDDHKVELSSWLLAALKDARPKDIPGWLGEMLPSLKDEDRIEACRYAESFLGSFSPTAQRRVKKLLAIYGK